MPAGPLGHRLHRQVVVGNAGSDPEMRYTPRDGEWVAETTWVRVTCWGRMAETANQYIKRGDRVLVSSDRLTFDPATGGSVIFTRSSGPAGASFKIAVTWANYALESSGAAYALKYHEAELQRLVDRKIWRSPAAYDLLTKLRRMVLAEQTEALAAQMGEEAPVKA